MSEENVTKMTKRCPFCDEDISVYAKKCRHCGETIDVVLRMTEELKHRQDRSESKENAFPGNIVISNSTQQTSPVQPPYIVQQPPYIPSPQSGVYGYKKKTTYLILGICLGTFGAHNLYAGYTWTAVLQLLLGLTCFLGFISSIWAIIEVCTVDRDATGKLFI